MQVLLEKSGRGSTGKFIALQTQTKHPRFAMSRLQPTQAGRFTRGLMVKSRVFSYGLTMIKSPPCSASSHSMRNGPDGTFACGSRRQRQCAASVPIQCHRTQRADPVLALARALPRLPAPAHPLRARIVGRGGEQ